jgi:hypothetical protein
MLSWIVEHFAKKVKEKGLELGCLNWKKKDVW